MKLLGKFLIDRGFISAEDYVGAMVHQAIKLPPLALAVHDLSLMSIEEQVRVFDYQVHHQMEYRVSAVQLGLWNEAEFHSKLIPYYFERLKSLGDILVEQKKMTLMQLSDALALYIQSEADGTMHEATLFETKKNSPRRPAKTSYNATDTLYIRMFGEHFHEARYESILSSSPYDTLDSEVEMLNFLQNLQMLCAFIRADRTLEMFQSISSLIKNGKDCTQFSGLYTEAWKSMWLVRDRILGGETEDTIYAEMGESLNELRTKIERECRS